MKSAWLPAMLAVTMLPASLCAQNGAALYKSKCAACHGENGEGRPRMKMPAVAGTAMTAEQLATYLLKGEPGKKIHNKPVSGMTEERARAISEFVKSLGQVPPPPPPQEPAKKQPAPIPSNP